MSRTIKEFSEILFSTFDLQRIWARPFESNKASQRALEKVGFVCEGILKQIYVSYKKIRFPKRRESKGGAFGGVRGNAPI